METPAAPLPPHEEPPTRLAAFALALAIGGFCLFPLAIGAFIESIRVLRRPAARGSAAYGIAIAALCIAPFSIVSGLGACTAVAIPAFVKYMRRSKVSEAEANVAQIFSLVERYAAAPRSRPDGTVGGGVLPRSIPLTPGRPGCDRQLWPADADPAWRELGFAPTDPLYFGYQVAVEPDGRHFAVRAVGDLDCDSIQSLFERAGVVEADGHITAQTGLYVERETE